MDVASLNVNLTAGTAQFKIAMEKATQQLDKLGGKSDGLMAKLKDSFGRGSTFGQFAKLFAGGGAIIGLSIATRELEKMTAKGAELADQLREGKISGGEMAYQLAQSIPVFGNIVKAGADINEMFTGDALALKHANEEAKRSEETMNAMRESLKAGDAAAQSMADSLAKVWRNAEMVGNPGAQAIAKFEANVKKQVDAFAGPHLKEADSLLNPKGQTPLDDLLSQSRKIRGQLSTMTVPEPVLSTGVHAGGGMVGSVDIPAGTVMNQGDISGAEDAIETLKKQLADVDDIIKQRREQARRSTSGIASGLMGIAVGDLKSFGVFGKSAATEFYKAFQTKANELGAERAAKDPMKLRAESLFKSASEVFEKTRSPAEKLAGEMSDLNAMVAAGAINWNTYARAATDANIEFAKAMKSPDEAKAMKMQPTVQPAREFRFTEGIPGARANPLEQLQPIIKDNNKETQENTREIKEHNRLLRNSRAVSDTGEAAFSDLA